MPNVADGLLNKYWHIAASARGQATVGAIQLAGALTALLSLNEADPTPGDSVTAHALSAGYDALGTAAGGLSVTA
jgi:hypothetical protein